MPAYNAEKYVGNAIASVIAQTYSNWELIVLDDGSTDNTEEVVRELAGHDSRIKYFFQENGKQGKARNTAIAHAQGELLAFLDADDQWLEQKLELQLQAMSDTAADVVYSSGFIFREDDAESESRIFPTSFGKTNGPRMLDMLICRNTVPVTSVVMRRETFLEAGWFEESAPYQSCEDYDLWIRAAKTGASFYGMEDKLFRYRRHMSAATNKDSAWLKPMLRVVQRHITDTSLTEAEKRTRLRQLFRDLITALIDEDNLNEARQSLEELSKLDSAGAVTSIQKWLMSITPRGFNFLSRHLLYRVEWHVKQLMRDEKTV
jgi:glycosyltransferase involved in cell wall biosynthesis